MYIIYFCFLLKHLTFTSGTISFSKIKSLPHPGKNSTQGSDIIKRGITRRFVFVAMFSKWGHSHIRCGNIA